MVRAILEGRKNQTRRLLKRQPIDVITSERATRTIGGRKCWCAKLQENPPRGTMFACRYGEEGDQFWVREACILGNDDCPTHQLGYPPGSACWCGDIARVRYAADGNHADAEKAEAIGWRPSIHMPRWASRLSLEITDVRVQRLQAISEADARAEGCIARNPGDSAKGAFERLWNDINGERAPWASNPFVWALSFKPIARPA
jgi:hypothetical protein